MFCRGRRGVQNLPVELPDRTPVDFHARKHVKSVGDEVIVDIPDASRRLNIRRVCTIPHSIPKSGRLCSQAEVGHFKNLL